MFKINRSLLIIFSLLFSFSFIFILISTLMSHTVYEKELFLFCSIVLVLGTNFFLFNFRNAKLSILASIIIILFSGIISYSIYSAPFMNKDDKLILYLLLGFFAVTLTQFIFSMLINYSFLQNGGANKSIK